MQLGYVVPFGQDFTVGFILRQRSIPFQLDCPPWLILAVIALLAQCQWLVGDASLKTNLTNSMYWLGVATYKYMQGIILEPLTNMYLLN